MPESDIWGDRDTEEDYNETQSGKTRRQLLGIRGAEREIYVYILRHTNGH